ncbi:MAG: purine-nucleoside phosphorylase [Candidatus Cloacimonadota bacterium]|nr:purine-nucleoside phosphorylase [Candidatus Cloacimonadota bacterium]
MELKKRLNQSVKFISEEFPAKIDTAIILGTGLNKTLSSLSPETEILYKDIPHLKTPTAPSHKGTLIIAKHKNQNVAIMRGRLHCYEGYSAQDVTYPIYLLKELGAKNLIITNAAGSLNKNFQPGSLILIQDHINLTGKNPLIGPNDARLGTRFPSMHNAYNKKYIEIIKLIAKEQKIQISEGIYAGLIGPNLETKAECRMLQRMGADMVGMSTVLEVIAGVYLNLKILGISSITNMSNLFHSNTHKQSDIEHYAKKSQENLNNLISEFLNQI